MNKPFRQILTIFATLALMIISGCSSSPKTHAPIIEGNVGSEAIASVTSEFIPEYSNNKGSEIFNIAQGFLGTPYRYGGGDPSGFDCSGLVQYSHLNAGINVPRTAAAQYKIAHPVSRSELKPGDVIFFRVHWRKISHVGIYAGQGKFIHAPSSGKHVTFSSLNEPYWQKRIVKTGRFY